jgi:predicted acylesterase/phospholipase RssA
MLTTAVRDNSARVGLALAGGGPEGAICRIGVLRDSMRRSTASFQQAAGRRVSAGAFVAANLANQITTANVRAIIRRNQASTPSCRRRSHASRG